MRLGVIGGGAWGTALAQVAASEGEDTLLWALEPDVVDARPQQLACVELPIDAEALLPAGFFRQVHAAAQSLRPQREPRALLDAIGIEAERLRLLQVVAVQVRYIVLVVRLAGEEALHLLVVGPLDTTAPGVLRCAGAQRALAVHYDPDVFTATAETITIDDARLGGVWGERIGRIILAVRQPQAQGGWSLTMTV